VKLTGIESSQLRLAEQGVDIRSSDRPGDRARSKLKRLGLLVYERSYARWRITDLGRAALSAGNGPEEQS
jgi:hypothetical protein